MLQTQVLRVDQVNESCIGLIQENSIENSVQDCLPYILGFYCYDLKSSEWDSKTTLVLSNTRELDRVPKTK